MGPEEFGYGIDPSELDPDVAEFEARMRRARKNNEPTQACPSCEKTECLVNTICVYCIAQERDGLSDEEMYADLRQAT